MLKAIKITIWIFLVFCLLIFIALLLGPKDQAEFDDSGLLSQIPSMEPESNGRIALKEASLALANEIEVVDYNRISMLGSKKFVSRDTWDENYVASLQPLLEKAEQAIAVANQAPHLRFDTTTLLLGDINELELFRFVLLLATYRAEKGDLQGAVDALKTALSHSNRTILDSSHTLLSNAIGREWQSSALRAVHHLIADYDVSLTQLEQLSQLLQLQSPFGADQFHKVAAGEFAYGKALMDEDYAESNPIARVFHNYFLHLNRTQSRLAEHWAELQSRLNISCSRIETKTAKRSPPTSWWQRFRPNSWGEHWLSPSEYSLYTYQLDRCFSHAYLAAMQSIVAIEVFKKKHKRHPDNLSELVPEILPSIPVDPFNGALIRYSPSNEWLFSVGDNGVDQGGEKGAFYPVPARYCRTTKPCANNPTFPIAFERASSGAGQWPRY